MDSADSSKSPGRLPPPRSRQPEPDSPGGPRSGAALFRFLPHIQPPHMTMITSPHNEKLKLIRRLGRRRSRERDGLFVGEGEDLLAAAHAAGHEPVELLTAAGGAVGGAA